jgi:ABC-2 type transport system permease protein
MRVIDLTLKDGRQLVRDWQSAAFLIVMPLVFTVMMGFIFGGVGGADDPRLPVGFLDQDGSTQSAGLLAVLSESDVVRPVEEEGISQGELEQRVADGDWAGAFVIPHGYGEHALMGHVLPLVVILDPASDATSGVQAEIQTAAERVAGAAEAARLSADAYEERAGFASQAARREFVTEAFAQAMEAWEDPPLAVRSSQARDDAGEETSLSANAYAQSSPGMMVQFAIAGLIGAAQIIVAERKSRTMARLLTTTISRAGIIVGHFLTMFLMIFFQLALLIGFGQLVLQLDYLHAPLATLLLMVSLALWTASLGLLIGVLAKSDDQVVIFSMISMFVLSGLGGAWMPLEFTSETFRAVGHLTPTAWAMDGFKDIIVRGLGLNAVLPPAGVLLAWAAVCCGVAVWRFRFE